MIIQLIIRIRSDPGTSEDDISNTLKLYHLWPQWGPLNPWPLRIGEGACTLALAPPEMGWVQEPSTQGPFYW